MSFLEGDNSTALYDRKTVCGRHHELVAHFCGLRVVNIFSFLCFVSLFCHRSVSCVPNVTSQ
jgi:hypothetical protein